VRLNTYSVFHISAILDTVFLLGEETFLSEYKYPGRLSEKPMIGRKPIGFVIFCRELVMA
jgi:hypothetical protein